MKQNNFEIQSIIICYIAKGNKSGDVNNKFFWPLNIVKLFFDFACYYIFVIIQNLIQIIKSYKILFKE